MGSALDNLVLSSEFTVGSKVKGQREEKDAAPPDGFREMSPPGGETWELMAATLLVQKLETSWLQWWLEQTSVVVMIIFYCKVSLPASLQNTQRTF